MRRFLALSAILVFVAGCSYFHWGNEKPLLNPHDYQWHKETHWIKLHWSYTKNEDGTLTAHGFVEPQDPRKSVHTVKLRLAGVDHAGKVVSETWGAPVDTYISGPNAQSEFSITLAPDGSERRYTIDGSYHYYLFGKQPDFTRESRDELSLDPPR